MNRTQTLQMISTPPPNHQKTKKTQLAPRNSSVSSAPVGPFWLLRVAEALAAQVHPTRQTPLRAALAGLPRAAPGGEAALAALPLQPPEGRPGILGGLGFPGETSWAWGHFQGTFPWGKKGIGSRVFWLTLEGPRVISRSQMPWDFPCKPEAAADLFWVG